MGVTIKNCERSRFSKELQQIFAECICISDASRDLFGISDSIHGLIEEMYETETGEDLGEKSDKIRRPYLAAIAAEAKALDFPKEWEGVTREAFLDFCSEIFDQNERVLASAIGEKCCRECKRRKIEWDE